MNQMISVASGFQFSVNIGYDLNNDDKLRNFIPTRSALELLEDILSSTAPSSTNRARVLIGAYMNAAVFGLLYSRTAKRDTTSDDRARVYADAFATERENCVFLYRMVMLLDKTTELTPEERVDRAFRYDTQPEKAEEFKKNMDLFHDYVRGGIEVMYEQFTDGCQTQDDYLSKTYEVMTTFKKELEGISYAEELAKLIR